MALNEYDLYWVGKVQETPGLLLFLTPRQCQIIDKRLFEGATLKELGETFDVSGNRIRGIIFQSYAELSNLRMRAKYQQEIAQRQLTILRTIQENLIPDPPKKQ